MRTRHARGEEGPETREKSRAAELAPRWLQRVVAREPAIVLALSLVAAIRVFLFCAAFPFFGNADETDHFDTVGHYARADLPAGLTHLTPATAHAIALYGSWEYEAPPAGLPDGQGMKPRWTAPPAIRDAVIAREAARQQSGLNVEATQPPVYYAIAACWLRLGGFLGIRGGRLLYWVRFLNVGIAALLVGCAYLLLRELLPARPLTRMAVVLLVALLPQDSLYTIGNDTLSPLLFCASLLALVRIRLEPRSGYGFHLLAGALTAATFLTKYTNVAILVLVLVAVIPVRRNGDGPGPREQWTAIAALLLAAVVPIALWLLRNEVVLGDSSGSAAKIAYLGWKVKPLGRILDHPILSPSGLAHFLAESCTTFWRGELGWHGVPLASRACDLFYAASSVLFVPVGSAVLWVGKNREAREQRLAGAVASTAVAVSIVLLIGLSMAFDFGTCVYPSRERPYMTSGRLISGSMVPFLLLYVTGLEWLLGRLRLRAVFPFVVMAIAVGITACEAVVSRPVFGSVFNWFHIGGI